MNITREEANAIYSFKTSVLSDGFSSKKDPIELASACQEFYTDFLSLARPAVFIADGPKDAIVLLNHILGKEFSRKYEEIVAFRSHESSSSARKTIDYHTFSLAGSSKETLKERLGKDKFREARNILFRDLNFQFSRSVYQVIERSFFSSQNQKGGTFSEFAAHPSFSDRDWLNFHKGCSLVFGHESAIPTCYSNLLNSGFFFGFFLSKLCGSGTRSQTNAQK